MDGSFLSVMNAVLDYVGVPELQYGFSFGEVRIRDIVDAMTSSGYLPKQSGSSCVRYVRFVCVMENTSIVLPLMKALREI